MQEVKNIGQPLISIILPCYNGKKYLSQSIESCLNQTYKNIELIIVNDCSTDSSLLIANYYARQDNRVKVVNNKINRKLPASLNIGHNEAKGNFITWTSHDNFYERNALEVLLNEILEKELDIVYSNFNLIDNEGNNIREVNLPNFENIILGNVVSCCFLYKLEVFERNMGYNENFFLVEDYDFWLRSISHSKFGKINRSLYRYRKHSETLTSQIATDDLKNAIWKTNVFKMYNDFCTIIIGKEEPELANLFYKRLSHDQLDFNCLKNNKQRIKFFKEQLLKNFNFRTPNALETLFMKKHIEILVDDKNLKNYRSASFYIIKNYFKVIDKNSLKTLIKFSFFK